MNYSYGIGASADANYIVSSSQAMDPIPDHCIQSPFGRLSKAAIKNDDRFNKYRAHIVGWYRVLYDRYMYTTAGYTCEQCGARLSSTKSGKVLGHLASMKHLKAVGIALDEKDQRGKRVAKYKYITSAASPVEGVVADVTDGLGDK